MDRRGICTEELFRGFGRALFENLDYLRISRQKGSGLGGPSTSMHAIDGICNKSYII